ncbi:MAG: phosphorylase, partial [Bdellovibrionia bacterium]
MQRRFHADPTVLATELLLQERTPHSIGTLPTVEENIQVEIVREPVEHVSRRYHTVNRPIPTTHLLSNGNYTVMLTSAGSGFSRIRDLAVTRWREDVTCDNSGYFIYLKDCDSQNVWSAGHQPVCTEANQYEVSFAEDRARIVRQDFGITSELEVFVSPEENAEIRRLTLTNNSSSVREIEITSYLEVVLNSQGADKAHPAFSNLFVETEFNPELSALFASRRPRSKKEKRLWMMHLLRGDRHTVGPIQHETDRGQFIGRGRSVMNPAAIFDKDKLSGTVGPVLDPILSLRTRVRLEPGEVTHLTFSCGVSEDREAIEIMADKFNDPSTFERASDLAWTQAQVKLHYLGVEPDEAHLYQRLTTRLLYSDPSLRPPSEILKKNFRDVTGLWAYGISGDHPIILVRIDEIDDRNLIRQLLRAQIYFATKGFVCDLVILNDKASSYSQELQKILEQMAQAAHTPSELALTRGQVFVLRSELIPEADQILLDAESRVLLSTRHGSLSDQVKRTFMHRLPSPKTHQFKDKNLVSLPVPKMEFFNGYGGFSNNGEEYTIVLKDTATTPAPWINVIANQNFGFQVSESGSGYTWSLNSRENQLTPWSNDPVSDPSSEAFFIRDRDSGMLWSPTAAPIRIPEAVYLAHHGRGYSRFETAAFEIYSELKQFVEADHPVKVSRLTLENKSKNTRRLSVTGYVEWVLGFSRMTMAPTTLTEFDPDSQAVFAWNPRNTEHGKRIAFSAVLGGHTSFTCDRTEFIGRNSNLSKPLALLIDEPLKKRAGGGLDPCTALSTDIELKPGQKIEIFFILGQTSDRTAAREAIARLRKANMNETFERVCEMWQGLLGQIQVETPDRSFDLMINSWYLYQTIACRLWARAAFYQVGGAYGFRDQLQDVMALMTAAPQLAREQILRAAARQFVEGDVQHWWHPPLGRGVRTRFSDDLLWLPYVVSHYLSVTQDKTILDEQVGFIEGPPLEPDK